MVSKKEKTQLNYEDLISNTPSCLKLVSKEGSLLNMSLKGLELIEANSLDSVLNQCVYDIIHEDYREEFKKFNQKICSGEKGHLIFKIVGLKGRERWMESFSASFPLPNGELAHVSITNDITEKKSSIS